MAAGGLTLCPLADVGADASAPADCAATSEIGTATLASDLTATPLRGAAYLTQPPHDGDLAGVALDLALDQAPTSTAARLKLIGRLRAEASGRLELSFDALPTLPIGSLTVALRGGARSVLTAPASCGAATLEARLTPTAPGSAAEPSSVVTIADDCAEPAPSATAALAAKAPSPGARSGFELTLTRSDRAPALSSFSAQLPAGAAVDLRGTAPCERSVIEAGGCAANAALGSVQFALGAGPEPSVVSAPLYRLASDEAALAMALARVPVRLGDLDFGTVDVPVALGFDAQARRLIVAAAMAAAPIDVQSVGVTLRAGIGVNPTSCSALDLSAAVHFAGGANADARGSLGLAGCAGQPLAPAFRASLSGESAIGGHPRAALSITPRDGDANIATLGLGLPAGLALDASHPSCDAATFSAGGCSPAAQIGSATVSTSLTDGPVGGTLTLLRIPGQALPGIGLAVSGAYGFRSVATVAAVEGRQVASFTDLPDLPLTQLDLVLDGGSAGALKVASQVCSTGAAWRATVGGHGGQSAQLSSAVACQARPTGPTVELSVKAKTGLKLKLANFGGQRLQSAKLTLSPRMRFVPAAARRGRNTAIAVIGPKAKPTFSSTSLTLSVGAGKAPQELVARVRWPAMSVRPRGHRKTTFRLRLAFADGSVLVRDVLVTLPAKLPAPVAAPGAAKR